ncbi:hypothetical protein KKE92_02875 [Candidatus Micrarchaeota archaeon]|nr:hypothetical protein [Candidatus Micrarchaeota archaeon]
MAKFKIDKLRGYFKAVNKRPSQALIEKLKILGWKSGQCIYFDRKNLIMRFFDNKEELHQYLDSKQNDPHLDSMVDLELKFDLVEGVPLQ